MTTRVLAEILASLDMVVFERLPEGVLLRLGAAEPPSWFGRVFAASVDAAPTTVAETLPFMEHFLSDAEKFWRDGDGPRLRSERFAFTDASGGEIWLTASAVAAGHRHFLVLAASSEFEERRRALQSARENALVHEEHVRRTGGLLKPVDAARQLLQQLEARGLTGEQAQLAAALHAELEHASTAIRTLAPLPKGVSRSRRP